MPADWGQAVLRTARAQSLLALQRLTKPSFEGMVVDIFPASADAEKGVSMCECSCFPGERQQFELFFWQTTHASRRRPILRARSPGMPQVVNLLNQLRRLINF
eukprot:5843052-Amphidinium_carterae.1